VNGWEALVYIFAMICGTITAGIMAIMLMAPTRRGNRKEDDAS
jgi:hypothetical protein